MSNSIRSPFNREGLIPGITYARDIGAEADLTRQTLAQKLDTPLVSVGITNEVNIDPVNI